jgi:hypothetical protein
MNEIALLSLLHLLGLVYWLGADLGVFYTSYILCDEQKSPGVRVSAAKILFALDQAPRISMTLMLPLGVHLASAMGYITAPAWLVPAVWLLAAGWLAMVLALHFLAHRGGLGWLARVDFWFRVAMVAALVSIAALAISGQLSSVSAWAGWKLGIFGVLVACGLAVRIKLKPFGPAFGRLATGTGDAADNAAISASMAGSRPFVLIIWAGLLVNSALGVHLI